MSRLTSVVETAAKCAERLKKFQDGRDWTINPKTNVSGKVPYPPKVDMEQSVRNIIPKDARKTDG